MVLTNRVKCKLCDWLNNTVGLVSINACSNKLSEVTELPGLSTGVQMCTVREVVL